MDTFLKQAIGDLITRYGVEGLQDITLVMPTRRAAVYVKDYIRQALAGAHSDKPVCAPQMLTLTDLFNRLSSLYADDELHIIPVLHRVYCHVSGENIGLDLFWEWGRQLLQDFSDIDKSYPQVQAEALLSHTTQARDLERLVLDEETRRRLEELVAVTEHGIDNDIRRKAELLWRNMLPIYKELQTALGQKTYEGARMKDVIVRWDRILPRLQGQRFVFIGFNYLTPAERELMRLLRQAGQAEFYWDFPSVFRTNDHAFRHTARNAALLPGQLPPEAERPAPQAVEIVQTASQNAQAQYVADWLRRHHAAGKRTAVVLCNEALLEPVIYALPAPDERTCSGDTVGRINITKGFPLSHTQIYREVMDYLADPDNAPAEGGSLTAVIDRMAGRILKNGRLPIGKDGEPQSYTDLNWHQLLLLESFYQMRLALNRMRSLIADGTLAGIGSLHALRTILRRYLATVTLPFHGEPVENVQVIGMLETRLLDFDNILMLGVEEGIVPQRKADGSYIPYYLRKAYGLQTNDETADIYACHFFRLLRHAANVSLLFCGATAADNKSTMSRFIMQMMIHPEEFTVTRRVLTESATTCTPSFLLPGSGEERQKRVFSPSALNTWLRCPMQYYLRYVLGIHEAEPETLVFGAAETGNFFHAAVEHAYRLMAGDRFPYLLTPDKIKSFSSNMMDEAVSRAYRQQNEEYAAQHAGEQQHYRPEEHQVENSVIRQYVRNVLEADLLIAAKHRLEIVALELSRHPDGSSLTTSVTLSDGITATVEGRIDRVDRVDGQLRIVDYKTGACKEEKLKADDLHDIFLSKEEFKNTYLLQTLAYSAVYAGLCGSDDILPCIYFPREKPENVVHTFSIGGAEVNFGTVRDGFTGELRQLFDDLIVHPRWQQPLPPEQLQTALQAPKCSPFCTYFDLCGKQPPRSFSN
ncbi:MAG: PD-(D/E)XK nuclease family protein [Paludibacteraceae bacterium]|nr:PD-(D/E)XK nuclease family protein [Paludibacteraceae bacterium]